MQGIVNQYYPVHTLLTCENAVLLDSTTNLQAGDRVMLYQAQGAQINRTNTPGFGQVQQLQGAGLVQWNTIVDIQQDTVKLRHQLQPGYDVTGNIQLLKVPSHTNITITDTIYAQPWDGRTGGVVAIEATGALNFAAPISVHGSGFRGGDTLNEVNCNPILALGYTGIATSGIGGGKGEGIAQYATDEAGRGPLANGGGGGNDHNSGGGGGSNLTPGGQGGERRNAPFGCGGPFPGIGGVALPLPQGHLFFGGGGGAGDQNNLLGSRGGRGGGIVIIKAPNIQANGNFIDIRGESVSTIAGGDGSGGGGAAGSVWIDGQFINGVLRIEGSGGTGGSTDNSNNPNFCMGPGGGGSGGYVKMTIGAALPNVFANVQGGAAGITVNGNANAACAGSSNGAQPGSAGRIDWGADTIPFGPVWLPFVAQVMATTDTVCPGGSVQLLAQGGQQFAWQPDSLLDDPTSATPMATPDVTTTFTLQATDSNGCVDDTSITIVLRPATQIFLSQDTAYTCPGIPVKFVASGAHQYQWYPADSIQFVGTTGSIVTMSPRMTTTYTVIGSGGPCPPDTALAHIIVWPAPEVYAMADTTITAGDTLVLSASANTAISTWQWSPDNSLSSATANPSLAWPGQSTVYTIQGTDSNGCTASDTVTIEVVPQALQDTIPLPNAFSPNGDGRNDVWQVPTGDQYQIVDVRIFNRWGALIAVGGPAFSWDGTLNDIPQPAGSYLYQLSFRDNIGFLRQQQGYLILLR